MKKLLYTLFILMILAGSMISRAQASSADDEEAPTDSTVDVIGWFTTTDTVEYWVQNSNWKLTAQDTTKISGISIKTRIVVTDSTSVGYQMEYTILDFRADSIDNSAKSIFIKSLINNHVSKLIGTTIVFETNEYGHITKFNNLEQVKNRLFSYFNDAIKEVFNHPDLQGINISDENKEKILKAINEEYGGEKLISSFVKQLEMIFSFHGLAFKCGESVTHDEATDDTYASDTWIVAEYNDEVSYTVSVETHNHIPMTDLYDFLKIIVGNANIKNIYDIIASMKGAEMSFISSVDYYYRYDGWPEEILTQDIYTYGSIGRAFQTQIYLVYIGK